MSTPPDALDERPPVIDLATTARRLGRVLAAIGVVVLAVWVVRSTIAGAARPRELAELVGFGLVAAFVVEVVVVGGAAMRGLLAAGARGDRLSGPDVALLPPQWRRRLRRRPWHRDDAC